MDEWGQSLNLGARPGSLGKPTSEFLIPHL